MNLSSIIINKTPIITSIADNEKNSTKSNSSGQFKNIFSNELEHLKNNQVSISKSQSSSVNKIKNIKEKLANNFYFKNDISDLIAEKLMHTWGQ
ncbi:hypothetical protein KAZ01_03050 [Candidatus Gracilibacteria bacterium]|nr:hypothetical protein [Candidatus Gracilibacteria bacterium]